MRVAISRSGSQLIVKIDNPPVNALSHAVRSKLISAVDQVNHDTGIDGVILTGSDKFFSAGADISEFGKEPLAPYLPDLINALENCRVPVIAALSGTVLGGGLELALGCRYRVAHPAAKLGLPEVNLGLIPGAGGTQRLPRLIGVKEAADFITKGQPVSAKKALTFGMVDLISENPVDAAQELADKFVRFPQTIRPAISAMGSAKAIPSEEFSAMEQALKKKTRGQLSPLIALKAIGAACDRPFREGLMQERQLFQKCMQSPQREALIYAFYAQRKVSKIAALKDVTPRPVQHVGILGAGTMGAGIAIACAEAGFEVDIYDINHDALEKGMAAAYVAFDRSVSKGRRSAAQADQLKARIRSLSSMDGFSRSDLIVEAVVERMDVKQSVFKALEAIVGPQTILASNTSYLNINDIAAVMARPDNVIGMHFFSPANIMRLLEIVKTDTASPEALATGFAVGKAMGKICVQAGICDGFIGNRIFKKYRAQAEYLLEEGALPQDIDSALRSFGFPMGPFQISDLAGLDIAWHNRRKDDATRDPAARYVHIADWLYERGRLGQKTGAGWYDYQKGDRTPIPSQAVEALIVQASAEKGLKRRPFSEEQILKIILTVMYQEGQAILAEGIAATPEDIDMVMIHGYGFPKHRGGLMYYGEKHLK